MRRTTIALSAALMLLVLGPASALARHHSRHHRSRAHHTRVLRFGDTNSGSASSTSSDNAGTVASFEGGILTINTSDGPVRGSVTDATECSAPSQGQTMHEDRDSGGGGEHSGSRDDRGQAPNDENEANDNEANDNEANQNEANENQNREEAAMSCTPANLPDGTVVREAVLRISGAGRVWKKVELGS